MNTLLGLVGIQRREAFNGEALLARWWREWLERDYSWDGLGRHLIGGEGGNRGERTLQDYWRADSAGHPRTDDALRVAGELRQTSDGRWWHIAHLPMESKAAWPEEEWLALEHLLLQRLSAASETEVDLSADPVGKENRAIFDGVVLRRLRRDAPGETHIRARCSYVGELRFPLQRLGKGADFSKMLCTRPSSFYRAKFANWALFREAVFVKSVDFNECTFAYVNFDKATFLAQSGFGGATFEVSPWFSEANFAAPISFREASFGAGAIFHMTTFRGVAWFVGATFADYANFYGTTFEDESDFRNVRWKNGVSFREVRFRSFALFENSTFHPDTTFFSARFEAVPRAVRLVHATTFVLLAIAASLVFSAVQTGWFVAWLAALGVIVLTLFIPTLFERQGIWFLAGFQAHDEQFERHMRSFRILTTEMERLRNKLDAARFNRLELLARGLLSKEVPVWYRLAAWLYGVFSSYGESALQAAAWFGISILGFAAVYRSMDSQADEVWSYLSFSISRALPFLAWPHSEAGVVPTEASDPVALFAFWSVAAGQSILSVILLFLFALALRRSFQLS